LSDEPDFAVDSVLPVDNGLLAQQPLSDLGNSRRLVARYGNDLRAVGDVRSQWLIWDGRRWTLEGGLARAMTCAHNTADAIALEVRALEEAEPDFTGLRQARKREARELHSKKIAALRKWITMSGNRSRWIGMLEASVPQLQVKVGRLDSKPFLLNLPNGTVDLEEDIVDLGRFRVGTPCREDLLTRLGGAAYDPEAVAPHFRLFLDRIVPDRERQNFLQRWFGYCLSGDMSEQKMLIAYGTGANGKSTLFEVLLKVLGDYGITIDIKTLLHNEYRRGADATPDLARLPGTRLAVASEPEASDRLAESLVKTITGGDKIVARPLYRDPFEFSPTFRLCILTNVKPTIRGTDEGVWRRILLFPFDQVIPLAERQSKSKLTDQLLKEASGILHWMLDGWLAYRESGLAIPDSVLAETELYRAENNPIGQFLEAATVADASAHVSASLLYAVYAKWCRANAIEPRSQKWFGSRLTELNIKRETIGISYYIGLKLVREDFGEEGDDDRGEPT